MAASLDRYRVLITPAKFALTLTAIVVAQGVLSLKFEFFKYFDLPLIYTIYYGFTLASPTGSIAIGSVLGLMQDSLSGAFLGMNGFSKTLIGFLAGSAGSRLDVEQPIVRILSLVVFTLADGVLKIFLSATVQPEVRFFVQSTDVWALSVAFNTLFGMILFGYRSRFA